MDIKKVILVFKTHFDIGYTDLAVNVMEDYYTTMLDRVLDTCEQTKDNGPLRYVWTMPAWPLWMILQHASPDRVQRLEGFIRTGQVTWHALPYTSHYDAGCAEDAVWGLRYARLLSQRFQMPLKRAAKMTDVPGQGRFLPELLSEAGVRLPARGLQRICQTGRGAADFPLAGPVRQGDRDDVQRGLRHGAVCPRGLVFPYVDGADEHRG